MFSPHHFTDANFTTDPLPGFHAWFTIAYKITGNFLVSEEFLYSLQGAKVKDGTFAGQDIKLSYAAVPILLKYRKNSGFYVEAGGQAGFKVGVMKFIFFLLRHNKLIIKSILISSCADQ